MVQPAKDANEVQTVEVENMFLIANKLAPWKYGGNNDQESFVQYGYGP